MSAAVRFASGALAEIRREAARAYPFEGCGALLGSDGRVLEATAIPNVEGERPRTRFSVSPADYLAVEADADARGLRLLGFWHSHPDHTARPSATDREHAWPGLLTVVVAVANGRPEEVTAWQVRDGEPFEAVEVASDP
ncbi:MAG TPA: M67 family metallopeptidase [Vicinamibacteria bacterium]|nr:M67 family metallopeptidase [Vicinamibacteria bacterium]